MLKVTEELIRARRSVRTFDGNGLDEETLKELKGFAENIRNPYNIPIEFRFFNAEEHGLKSPVLQGESLYVGAKVKKVPHAEEAYGYAFETFVLYAQSVGVGTVWIGGTFNRDAFERAMELKDDEMMPCASPIGRSAEKMSLREVMMRKGVKADKRKNFGEIFFENDFKTSLTEEKAGRLFAAMEAVRWAPSAVNLQPWRAVLKDNAVHFYEKKTKGYITEKTGDLQKIDVGIALCHFGAFAESAGINVKFALSDPGLETELEYIASYTIE